MNNKTVIAEVISNNVNFSDFYNSVITTRIAEELDLDIKEPYIDLILISQNSTFVAKKAKTFHEEKNVAQKAPVDGIIIDNLAIDVQSDKKVKKQKFLYSIKIADFYYKDSAENMILRINKETLIKKLILSNIYCQYHYIPTYKFKSFNLFKHEKLENSETYFKNSISI